MLSTVSALRPTDARPGSRGYIHGHRDETTSLMSFLPSKVSSHAKLRGGRIPGIQRDVGLTLTLQKVQHFPSPKIVFFSSLSAVCPDHTF